MSRISDGAARAAAIWWRNNVGPGAKCDVGVGQSGSPDDLNSLLQITAIISMGRENANGPDQQALARFEEELYQYLIAFNEVGMPRLDVDYHPTAPLTEAAERAGLKLGISDWPLKTMMWVKANRVEVSHGYGGVTKEIYPHGGVNAIEEIVEREERGKSPL